MYFFRRITGFIMILLYMHTPVNADTTGSGVIAAKLAVAPLKVAVSTIELTEIERQDVTAQLSRVSNQVLEGYIKQGHFLSVKAVNDQALPSAASVAEMTQAAREIESDLLLEIKVLEFDGRIGRGFRTSLKEHMVVEAVVYESATGIRLWFDRVTVNLEKNVPLTSWSDAQIEKKYVSLAAEEALPKALSTLVGKITTDMAAYKPPVVGTVAAAAADFVVDVDRVPRTATTQKKDAYAVVIGIEGYRDLPPAEYTVRDAKTMKEYLVRVMGFPQENIITMLNERATKGDIEGYIGTWLKKNVDSNSTVVVYYAGHGAPNPVTGEPFLIPYDGNPAFLESSALPLKKIYQHLADLPAKEVFVFMDACFSGGGGRSVMAKGGRPVAISIENPMLATKKVVVMSAANGTQISSSYPEKKHGLFTYFVLKGLQGEADVTGDKIINIEKLYNYVTPNVKKIARLNDREQTPAISPDLDVLGSIARAPLAVIGK